MGPVATIILLFYQEATGRSPTWGWFTAIVAGALAWQFNSQLRKAENDLEQQVKSLMDAPQLTVVPTGFYADIRSLKERQGSQIKQVADLSCLHIRFKNNPPRSTERSVGENILAVLNFYDELNHLLCTCIGRWGDAPEPPNLGPGQSAAQTLTMADFGIGQERELDISFKYRDESDCFAVSNEIYDYPGWRHPKHLLSTEELRVRVRLRGINVDSSWDLWFRNPKRGVLEKVKLQSVGPIAVR